MNTNTSKKKVAIIGAGASGLCTAWLLEDEYDVTLIEKQDRLGGHAYTIDVPTPHGVVPIEAGFEFFSDTMFDEFKNLLAALQIPTQKYSMNYCFYNADKNITLKIPLFQNNSISWSMLIPSNLFCLLQFAYFIHKGKKILAQRDTNTTLEEYGNQIGINEGCKRNFIYPLLEAGWGIPLSEFKYFCAYNLLVWATKNKFSGFTPLQWNEIIGGTKQYINAIVQALKTTKIITDVSTLDITHENNQYTISMPNGNQIQTDHIIFATNAHEARDLLQKVSHSSSLNYIFDLVEYYRAAIAIHSDPTFMPKNKKDWSVANILYQNGLSLLTTYKAHNTTTPIFRSWIVDDGSCPMPNPLYALKHFSHAKITPNYFIAQHELQKIQGINNLWFAGLWTHDVDSHNSAIISAMKIAKRLAPKTERLKQLEFGKN